MRLSSTPRTPFGTSRRRWACWILFVPMRTLAGLLGFLLLQRPLGVTDAPPVIENFARQGAGLGCIGLPDVLLQLRRPALGSCCSAFSRISSQWDPSRSGATIAVALHGVAAGLARQLHATQLGLALQRPPGGLLACLLRRRVANAVDQDLDPALDFRMLAMPPIAWEVFGEWKRTIAGKSWQRRETKTPETVAARALRCESWRCRKPSDSGPGAGNRNRTYDLRITNAPLYQLSYSG